MVARNEVAVPLNQKLPAVETACVLKVSYLARHIPRIDVAQARFPANLRCTHQSLRPGVVRIGHFVVLVKPAHPVTVKFLVKLALADVLVNDVTQGRHILSPKSADFHTPFYLESVQKTSDL